ncbi:hypothetical protein SNOG_09933 [Parastagonospora nodorum SN15]|uniref:Uncharacterized protein n=1 Tax=Phaeosphaeria nodorum (strain SN15 / ATCC MYA-4574 / FGSC 10173) TaxID=321614 RepID=Q0UE81_PHANO|nr:hypothetical protein SNOG_09933 [Parastagonospora nodorum SN15]EAT82268.1 hypothetical protein SNOG_09933 [Parastagonospora nodorum SN15]
MRGIAHGHKVNGLPLCTPSIYAEIAFTIGHYVQKIFPDQLSSTQVSIENINIIKALVATLEEPQWLQTLVKVDEHLHTVAGFIMNAHDASDLEKECFVNHGWGSLTMRASENSPSRSMLSTEIPDAEIAIISKA